MKIRYVRYFLLSTILPVGICAMAGEYEHQSKNSKSGNWFGKMDLNGDGQVSTEENEKFARRVARRMDADGDGTITTDEWRKNKRFRAIVHRLAGGSYNGSLATGVLVQRMVSRHKDADANHDGQVSKAEARTARRRQMFARMDADGDGSISRQEFMSFKRFKAER